ncbi:hypothetical protein BKA70DRAFT_1225410 [Coprinopsis sp. MPI-PUGE-AT-0042]|nr:hypothetical protein BKA70DRAFT_1225410 [Coprinopsis sp. MPI-PUGE-AT-0042]
MPETDAEQILIIRSLRLKQTMSVQLLRAIIKKMLAKKRQGEVLAGTGMMFRALVHAREIKIGQGIMRKRQCRFPISAKAHAELVEVTRLLEEEVNPDSADLTISQVDMFMKVSKAIEGMPPANAMVVAGGNGGRVEEVAGEGAGQHGNI